MFPFSSLNLTHFFVRLWYAPLSDFCKVRLIFLVTYFEHESDHNAKEGTATTYFDLLSLIDGVFYRCPNPIIDDVIFTFRLI